MTTRQAAAVGKMKCISCLENYDARDAGTCKECYEEANETEEELKREIDDLKSKVAFLKFSTRSLHPTPFSDVVLIASDDPSTALPVPAHKAVLVSIVFYVENNHVVCLEFTFKNPISVSMNPRFQFQ